MEDHTDSRENPPKLTSPTGRYSEIHQLQWSTTKSYPISKIPWSYYRQSFKREITY